MRGAAAQQVRHGAGGLRQRQDPRLKTHVLVQLAGNHHIGILRQQHEHRRARQVLERFRARTRGQDAHERLHTRLLEPRERDAIGVLDIAHELQRELVRREIEVAHDGRQRA